MVTINRRHVLHLKLNAKKKKLVVTKITMVSYI